MKSICAFSSDSRTLYKADIYRVLALPNGHIVHFRYKKNYVGDNLLNNMDRQLDQRVVIFFTSGNTNEGATNTLTNTSIRSATISQLEISSDTDVFHAYLKLGEFCNVTLDPCNLIEELPPNKFFFELCCIESKENNNWQSRINAVKASFPNDVIFFRVKGMYEDGICKHDKELPISYQKNKKSCHYDLTQGKRYVLKMALGNPNESKTKIELSNLNEDVTINCVNPMETSVQFDDYDIPIAVKTLPVMEQMTLLTFKPINGLEGNDIGEYVTNIELNLKLSYWQSISFGFISTLAASAIYLAQPASKTATAPSDSVLIISGLLFWFSTGSLFFWFNKK